MPDVVIETIDATWSRLRASPDVRRGVFDLLTLEVPGARFMPAFKSGWDGKVRLLDANTNKFYSGLVPDVVEWCTANDFSCDVIPSENEPEKIEVSFEEVKNFIENFTNGEPREYQVSAVRDMVTKGKGLVLAPPNAGKTFMMFLAERLIRIKSKRKGKTLVIVPKVSLVKQLSRQFEEYGYEDEIHQIPSKKGKDVSGSDLVVTTWQSVYKQPKDWFDQFDLVFGDEAHEFASKCTQEAVSKMGNAWRRFGLTGSLSDSKISELTLRGLFGAIVETKKTSEMIELGYSTPMKVQIVIFEWPDEARAVFGKGKDYAAEYEYLIFNSRRNKFITDLALDLEGNTVVLFRRIEHGEKLMEAISKRAGSVPVYLVHGGTLAEERDEIYKKISSHDKSVVIASEGTTSTGIDIPNIHDIIRASPLKSKTRNLQIIGRGLRTHESKVEWTMWDLADDMCLKSKRGSQKKNITYRHLENRMQIYVEEGHEYEITRIKLS